MTVSQRPFSGPIRRFLLLFTIGVLSACGGSSGPDTVALTGWVSAQEGIRAADLAFYTVAGSPIDEPKLAATNGIGGFEATIRSLPSDFRVVARGGTHMGDPSSATLSADYRGYTAQTGPIHVNPLTTMVSRYLDLHPSATLGEAMLAVKRFLAIPEWFDIGRGLTPNNKFFSTGKFLDAAEAGGGVDATIDALVARIDGAARTAAFAPDPALPRSVQSKLAMALAEGAATYVGGQAAGWALAKTGLWQEDGVTAAEVQDMQATLQDLGQALEDVKNELTEIRKQIDVSTYDIRVSQMGDLVSSITDLQDRLVVYATSTQPNPATRDVLLSLIRTQLLTQGDVIHNQQVGGGSSTPLIDLWGRIAQAEGNYRFVASERYNPKVRAEFEYFQKLQESRLLLEIEYWHANGEGGPDGKGGTNPHDQIDYALAKYQTNMAAQEALFRVLPDNTVVDTSQKMMYATTDVSTTFCGPDPSGWSKRQICFHPQFPQTIGRADFDVALGKFNAVNAIGFSDWRKPEYWELMSAFPSFSHCEGTGWPQAHGWPLPSDRKVDLGSADYQWEGQTLVADFSVYNCNLLGLMDPFGGGLPQVVSDQAGNPGPYWNQPMDWIPVRAVSDDEYKKYLRP